MSTPLRVDNKAWPSVFKTGWQEGSAGARDGNFAKSGTK